MDVLGKGGVSGVGVGGKTKLTPASGKSNGMEDDMESMFA